MNKKFIEKLTEYLDSECSDYGMSYDYEWCSDSEQMEVTVKNDHSDKIKGLQFRFNEEKNELLIHLTEDCWYKTEYFDETVKYFWMLVAPALFPEN